MRNSGVEQGHDPVLLRRGLARTSVNDLQSRDPPDGRPGSRPGKLRVEHDLQSHGLQQRRMQAGRLLMDGMRQAQVARTVGVTRKAVNFWSKRLTAAGLHGLEGRPRGRRAGLSREQRGELLRLLMNGALAPGFATELWTVRRVRQLIEERFSRHYSGSQVHRILVGLGFSSQAPTPTELSQDGAVIRRWKPSDATGAR
jgi:transposase